MAQLFASLILSYALAKLINQSDTKLIQKQKKRKYERKPINMKLNNNNDNNKCNTQESNKLGDPRMSLFVVLMDEIFDNEIGIGMLLRKLDLYTVQLIFKYLDILCHPNPTHIIQFKPYYKNMQFQLKQSLNDLAIIINKQKEIYWNQSKKIINKPLSNMNISSLNKNAASFLPKIMEEENEWKLEERLTLEQLRKYSKKSVMYIPQNITSDAINCIKEYFESTQSLFQYLKLRLIKNVIDCTYNILSISGSTMIVLFDVDLHKKENGEKLYVVGIENDADSTKKDAEKWKMKAFMTKQDIMLNYNIFCDLLPKEKISLSLDIGHIEHFANLRIDMMNVTDIWAKLEKIRSSKQKKAKSKQKITKNIKEFHDIVWNGINKNNFKKIIFIETKRGSYKKQLLLPIKLENNNWIAITFNFNHKNGKWDPHQICIDCYDIRQKMALYKPFENKYQYQWLQNKITDLEIINNHNNNNYNNNYLQQEKQKEMYLTSKYNDLQQKCKYLENENICLKSENKDLKEQMKNLKQ